MQVLIDRNQDSGTEPDLGCGLAVCRMWSKKWRWQGRVKDEARLTSKADDHRRYYHMIIHHMCVVLRPDKTRWTCLSPLV